MHETRTEGQVKWYSKGLGWGTITLKGGEEVTVHYSNIRGHGFRTLQEGKRVEFDLVSSDKGLSVSDVVQLN